MEYNKQELHQYSVIDFCLDDIIRIDWVSHFINLQELTCCKQGIVEMEGIDKCQKLERIWLQSNSIETIRCIDKLPRLKLLYLGQNRIRNLKCFEKCINLEKLWLNSNRIENITGLNSLCNLLELNLAANNIESIGVGLDGMNSLRDLNISSNRLGNFKEVLNLTRLSTLQICAFSDQHYGENPICSLCNYQTFVLFHLPKLVRLDTMQVSEESKKFAESTFMKKRMYYNMRIKTIQRNTSNIIQLLKICKKVRSHRLDLQATRLSKRMHEIQRELDERKHISREDKADFVSVFTYGPLHFPSNPLDEIDTETLINDLECKCALIQGRMHDRDEDVQDLETIYHQMRKKIYALSEQNIHRLMTELETGGNIRFEEGRPQDKWYNSCIDLVRSRFNGDQMRPFGIMGINVTRVTRIHNRFLRNRFEDRLEQLVCPSDTNYKKHLEYLFYGHNPLTPNEIHRAMEEGFRMTQEYEALNLPSCVSLVNSVGSAEISRINQFLKNEDGFAQVRSAAKRERLAILRADSEEAIKQGIIQIPAGQLLICKIFLQKVQQCNSYKHFNPNFSPNEIWHEQPVVYGNYQGMQAVFRTKENDEKQKMWFVLENSLALPEYLVDFDYIMSQEELGENRRLHDLNVINKEVTDLFSGTVTSQSIFEQNQASQEIQKGLQRRHNINLSSQDLDISDMNCLKRPLHAFMTQCHIAELMENQYEFQEDEIRGMTSIETNLPPTILSRSQTQKINEHTIANLCRQRDMSKITYLNLFNNKIQCIEALRNLINLQNLVLSFNEIKEIRGLESLTALKKLDLSYNQIDQISNLESQYELNCFDLRHNLLATEEGIYPIFQFCPKLKQLFLKYNPLSQGSSQRVKIFDSLPELQRLDGQRLTEKDKENAAKSTVLLTPDLIFQQIRQKKQYREINLGQNIDGWQRRTEEINLSHLRIQTIENLSLFKSLRRLYLLDNRINQISGLDNLRFLEELSLEKNKISSISGFEGLKYLKKLDLGSNKIKRIENVSCLPRLTQLSLENNEITRLDGLSDLQCLMELYLGNNLIQDVNEIKKLQEQQRLIILDISGNPMSSGVGNNLNYRMYCIYHLRKLRVLDGVSIDPNEHLEAKETFAGRLSDDLLSNKLFGRKLTEIRELDLSHCKLRDFEDMFDSNRMPVLKELNLNGNLMSSLRFIGNLPTLKVLRLKQNRIMTLYVKPAPEEKHPKRGLFGVPALEFLDVSGNCLQQLYGLQQSSLKDLKVLLGFGNEITKIEHLDKLNSLRELDLSKNNLKSIDPGTFLPTHFLTTLRLDENTIKTVSNIDRLDSLRTITLQNNRISDFNEIDKLAELPNLIELNLASNPIFRKQGYRQTILKRLLHLVVLDRREITIEERKRLQEVAGITIDLHLQHQANFQHYPGNKLPGRLNSVNFDGVIQHAKQHFEKEHLQSPSRTGHEYTGQNLSPYQANNNTGFYQNQDAVRQYVPTGMGVDTNQQRPSLPQNQKLKRPSTDRASAMPYQQHNQQNQNQGIPQNLSQQRTEYQSGTSSNVISPTNYQAQQRTQNINRQSNRGTLHQGVQSKHGIRQPSQRQPGSRR